MLDIVQLKNNIIPMQQLPERMLQSVKTYITHWATVKVVYNSGPGEDARAKTAVPFLTFNYFPSQKQTLIEGVFDGSCIF